MDIQEMLILLGDDNLIYYFEQIKEGKFNDTDLFKIREIIGRKIEVDDLINQIHEQMAYRFYSDYITQKHNKEN